MKSPAVSAIQFALLLCFSAAVSATSLTETLRTALETHPSLLAAQADADAAAQGIRVAKSGRYPSLDLRLAAGREETTLETPMPAPLPNTVRETDLDREESSLTLRQPLFSGFSTSGNIEARNAEHRSALAQRDAQRNRVAQEAAIAHLEVIGARESLAIAQTQVTEHERTLGQVSLRLTQGVGQRVDVNQAESRLSRAHQSVLQRQQSLVRAEARYRRVVGVVPAASLTAEIPVANIPETEESAQKNAIAQRAEIQESIAQVDAAEAQSRVAKSGNYPDLSLELSRGRLENVDGTKGVNEDTTAMAILRYNLFRGGADLARRKAAASARTSALEHRRDTERQVQEEVSIAWGALQQSGSLLPQVKTRAIAIAAVLESSEAQFNLGRRSLLDVLDVMSEVHESRQALVQAGIEHASAQVQLLAATGSLVQWLSTKQESVP